MASRTMSFRSGLLACLLLFVAVVAFAAPQTELVEIPLNVGNANYHLDAKIYKPQGEGPFPLLVLTHGTPRTAEDRQKTLAETSYKNQCEYFAGLGYNVIFVVRRGFGTSAAPYAENPLYANGTRNYAKAGLEAAKDLRAAIEFMKTKPYVDSRNIVLAGQSSGGFSVIAAGSLSIEGVTGIINFAGGRGSVAPDKVQDEGNLLAAMGQYGKTSRVPTLWLYAENDHYFQPAVARAMYKAYTDNGGRAAFVSLPAYSDDGHKSFVGNRGAWEPYVRIFLAEINTR